MQPMPGTFFEHVVEVLDAARVLDLQDAENLALRIERPDVGLLVIFLLGEAPVARRRGRAVAADAGRLVKRRVLEPRIAAGADRIGRFLDRRNVREHDAVAAHVERLLGLPLRHLDAVDGDAGHRRHARHDRARFGDLRAVEHVLQAVAQQPAVPRLMLHLEHDSRRISTCSCATALLISAGEKHVSACWPASSARMTPLSRGSSAIP